MFEIQNRKFIGIQTKRINQIDSIFKQISHNVSSVCDLFAGSGVITDYFLKQGKKVICNDILQSNTTIYNCFFGKESISQRTINNCIEKLNLINTNEDNYFSNYYSNSYFSTANAKKIGQARDYIQHLFISNQINNREKDILLTILIYGCDKVASIAGSYDAFIKTTNNNAIVFSSPKLDQKKCSHIYNEDSNSLVKNIEVDLIYLDPPRTNRQYCKLYNLIENLIVWDKQTPIGKTMKVLFPHKLSDYSTQKAPMAFAELVKNIKSKYILMSYSQSSNYTLDLEYVKQVLSSRGDLSTHTFTSSKNTKEYILLCTIKSTTQVKYPTIHVSSKRFTKPVFPYIGNKYELLPTITKLFPKNISTFVDLFCGSLTVSLNITSDKIIANDLCRPVINLLTYLKQTDLTIILPEIEMLIEKYQLSNSNKNKLSTYITCNTPCLSSFNKASYQNMKASYNNSNDKHPLLFLLLIIYGYNRQFCFSKDENFIGNVGKGDFNKHVYSNLINGIYKIKSKNIQLLNTDYSKIPLPQDSFIYSDPPYLLSKCGYSQNGAWNQDEEIKLLDFLKTQSEKGIKFALSNVIVHKNETNDILLHWSIQNKFHIHHLEKKYTHSSYNQDKTLKNTREVLITNYYNF